MPKDTLQQQLDGCGAPCDAGAQARIRKHHELLLIWNRTAHLVSAGNASEVALNRHDMEAVQALPHLGHHRHLLDVGTGGGYPGLIWACCRPDLQITLVEANQRKAAFLRQAVHELDLPLVRILAERITTPDQICRPGATLWTTRAAGCGDLLLEAGAAPQAGSPVLVLYAGATQAQALRKDLPAGWALRADEPLASGTGGRLMVIDHS